MKRSTLFAHAAMSCLVLLPMQAFSQDFYFMMNTPLSVTNLAAPPNQVDGTVWISSFPDMHTKPIDAASGTSPSIRGELGDLSDEGWSAVYASSDPDIVTPDANTSQQTFCLPPIIPCFTFTVSESDIFLFERQFGTTTRINHSNTGVQADGSSFYPRISRDGNFVCYESAATNLDPADSDATRDIYLYESSTGRTELISVSSQGAKGNAESRGCGISDDGRYVSFSSQSTNLTPHKHRGIFIRDRIQRSTSMVSVNSSGAAFNNSVHGPSLSRDGRYVAFVSNSDNAGWYNPDRLGQGYVHDRNTGTTELVTLTSLGNPIPLGAREGGVERVAISASGRHVVFSTSSEGIVPGQISDTHDTVFTRRDWSDPALATTELVALNSNGVEADYQTESAYGRTVADDLVLFISGATNLAAPGTNLPACQGTVTGLCFQLYARDMVTGQTHLLSRNGWNGGVVANGMVFDAAGPGGD